MGSLVQLNQKILQLLLFLKITKKRPNQLKKKDRKRTNVHTHKNWNMDIYGSLFTTAKLWKPPECPSLGEWIQYIQKMEILFHAKNNKKRAIKPWKIWKTCYILYNSSYITFCKRQSHGDSKKNSACERLVRKEWIK